MLTSGSGTRGLAPFPAISCGKEGKDPPTPPLRRLRILETTFKLYKFLVPHPGKGNRKSWVKKECPHPPERPILRVVSSGLLSVAQEPRRRANGGFCVLRRLPSLAEGAIL